MAHDEPLVVPDTSPMDPVKVEPIKVSVPESKDELSHRYWVGTIKDSPYQNVTIAGVNFPRYIDPSKVSPDGETSYRPVLKGQVISLTPYQVDLVKRKVVTKVIRRAGPSGRPIIRNVDDVNYRSNRTDEPVAKYIFMIRVKDQMPPEFRDLESPDPETMAQ